MRTEETILLCVGVRAQSVLITEKSSFDCFDCLIMAGLKCVRDTKQWLDSCMCTSTSFSA